MITTAKWTLEQYHQMIDAGILDGQPVELLNGAITVQPLSFPDLSVWVQRLLN